MVYFFLFLPELHANNKLQPSIINSIGAVKYVLINLLAEAKRFIKMQSHYNKTKKNRISFILQSFISQANHIFNKCIQL